MQDSLRGLVFTLLAILAFNGCKSGGQTYVSNNNEDANLGTPDLRPDTVRDTSVVVINFDVLGSTDVVHKTCFTSDAGIDPTNRRFKL